MIDLLIYNNNIDINKAIEENDDLISYYCVRYFPNHSRDDSMQFGRIMMWKAIKCYENKGMPLKRWIQYYLKNKFITRIRYFNNNKKMFNDRMDRLDKKVHDHQKNSGHDTFLIDFVPAPIQSPTEILIDKDYKLNLIKIIEHYFNHNYKKQPKLLDLLIDYFINNMAPCDLVKKYNVPRYDNRIKNFTLAIKKLIKENEIVIRKQTNHKHNKELNRKVRRGKNNLITNFNAVLKRKKRKLSYFID